MNKRAEAPGNDVNTQNGRRAIGEGTDLQWISINITYSVGPLGVDVSDVDLHRAVILGLDQAVSGAALARDVEIYGGTGGVLYAQK